MELDLLGLLGRPRLQIPEAEQFQASCVVITGAGGSIGSAIAARLVGKVKRLVLMGHSEDPIFRLKQKYEKFGDAVQYVVCDVGNDPGSWLHTWSPDLVIHAAAHKHVGLMEQSPAEAFRNNTQATMDIAYSLALYKNTRMVFVSTDKAVRPTSVMGASKRLAEAYLLSCCENVSVCRFGNVIGSSGSLVEIVRDKLLADQPVTLTDPLMKRFFIVPEEAVDLVLAASNKPGLYTLEMGEPVLIKELILRVRDQLHKDSVEINIGKPLSGEKFDEDLYGANETTTKAFESSLLKISYVLDSDTVVGAINDAGRNPQSIVECANRF